jgi:hypothetical protein
MEPNRQERHEAGATSFPHEDFVRLPGLYRRWELEQVVDAGADFHLEEAGTASDGTQLLAVYRRERATPHAKEQ